MNLKQLMRDIDFEKVEGRLDIEITSPTFDSRKIEPGGLYVAVPGTQVDGHRFIEDVIPKGCRAVVCERLPDHLHSDVTYIQVQRSSAALGRIAANYYGRPSERMKLVGVTGTNGKTTTVTLLSRIFRALGFNVGFLSTIQNQINESVIPSTHTTPDAIQINELMRKMVDAGCQYCFMEVTSHAVDQDRVEGLVFAGGVFTNLTHDHLDYHKTIDAYFAAKKRFFDTLSGSAFALSNIDDPSGIPILQDTRATRKTYGLRSAADFSCRVIDNVASGLVIELEGAELKLKLRGRFNAYNTLAAYGASALLGVNKDDVLAILPQLEPVQGRFDFLPEVKGVSGIIDFAHTPDGLHKILSDVNEIKTTNGRLIAVVGCGGDKDKEKRPEMGKIAYDNSDILILTSDNPRSEEPLRIIDDMRKDFPKETGDKVVIVPDRREAIERACKIARSGDTILLAGRGHEQFQVIGSQKIPFNDKEILREYLSALEMTP